MANVRELCSPISSSNTSNLIKEMYVLFMVNA